MKRAALLLAILAGAVFTACGGSPEPEATPTVRPLDTARTASAASVVSAPSPTATPEPVRFLGVVLHPAMTKEASVDAPECDGILFSGRDDVSEVFTTSLKKNWACFRVDGAPDAATFVRDYRTLLEADGWTLTESSLNNILGNGGVGIAGTRSQGTERMALGYRDGGLFLAVLPAQ